MAKAPDRPAGSSDAGSAQADETARSQELPTRKPTPAQESGPDQSDPARPPRVRKPITVGELSDQFEVIRRVLEARRLADDEAEAAEALASSTVVAPTPEPAAHTYPEPPSRPEPFTPEGDEDVSTTQSTDLEHAPASIAAPAVVPTQVPTPVPATTRHIATARGRRGARRGGRGQTIAVVLIAFALLVCAGIAVFAVTHRQVVVAGSSTPAKTAAATSNSVRAASWVVAAVGPANVVACDVTVCALLRGQGFPASSLVTVRFGLSDVEQADAVVLTPVLRAQLGAGVNGIVSSEPLAVFGTGTSRVEVAAVALAGAGNYAHQLTADRAGRRAAGQALLENSRLTLAPDARTELADGLVDTRVCALLALLVGSHTIVVAGFTPVPPGAGADIPSAGVVIEDIDGQAAAGPPQTAAQQRLFSTVQAQQDPYLPMSAAPGVLDGHPGLRIIYSQPGPLGLLGGSTS